MNLLSILANAAKWLKYASLVRTLGTALVQAIMTACLNAEAELGPGNSAEKLAKARAALEKVEALNGKIDEMWPVIKQFIDLFVALKLK